MFAYWGPTEMVHTLDKKVAFIANEAAERFGSACGRLDKSVQARDRVVSRHLQPVARGHLGIRSPVGPRNRSHEHRDEAFDQSRSLALFAMVGGKSIGAVFAIPDYNPRIKKIDGRLFPFGVFKLLSKRQGFDRFRVISANVLPEYQRWGVGLVLLRNLVPKVLSSGLKEAEFSWVLESNHLSRRSLEKGGAPVGKNLPDVRPARRRSRTGRA